MKSITLSVLLTALHSAAFAISSYASEVESVILKCRSDHRSHDGALKELLVTKTPNLVYTFKLLHEGSGKEGTYCKQ